MYKIKFSPRLYQETILQSCINNNCLIILPTGLGKTKTSILVAIQRLNSFPNSKILFLTPTKPLASQIAKEFKDSTNIENITILTGEIPPDKREALWKSSELIVGTPQGCTNDIINNKVNLKEFSLIIFDEAHRAVSNYDYVWIAQHYNKTADYPKIIGLTASPGSDSKKINEICNNLFINEIELRTHEDPDVKPYIQETNITKVIVELPSEFKVIKKYLDASLKQRLNSLKSYGLIGPKQNFIGKSQLIALQNTIHKKLTSGEKDIRLWQGISLTAQILKIYHASELLETQGIQALHKYMNNIYESSTKTKVKATKNLVKDVNFKSAFIKTQKLNQENILHPKLIKLKEIIKEEINSSNRIIIFNQYRDSASITEKELNNIPNIKAKLFVGQLKKDGHGLTQKKQLEILNKFKDGIYNILISTSIGEEGLDIPNVDTVIFYEPVPSAIRTIQRRGRTARLQKGKVIILITKETRDEAYQWSSYHKEKRMYSILNKLKGDFNLETQPTLNDFKKKHNITIYADSREKNSLILKELKNLDVNIKLKNLPTDYIISEDIAIERKTIEDFVNSIVNKKILNQIKELREKFSNPLLIIEGIDDIYSIRKVHPNAIQGMLASIALNFKVPILYTKNYKETSSLLKNIALNQQKEKKDFVVRTDRKPLTLTEQQEFIIESLPGIGSSLAKSLLNNFKTIKKIINASSEDLQKVEKLGPKKAEDIKKVIDKIYLKKSDKL